jgi:hypothetical protein
MKSDAPSEWHRLFNAALNDQLSDAERGQLATVLKSSAEARQLWFLYQDNECSLAELKPRREAKAPRTGFPWFFWRPIAAAAALVIGAFVFYSEISERLGHPAAVARFWQLDGCRWMDPATRVLSGDGIAAGQRVELSAGRAELHFATGARVTLLGPAIFELRSKNGGFLTLGEVSVAAETAESKGFVLATPTSDFVDIGTAFSAGVSADGLSRLEVSEGIVDVVFDRGTEARRLRAGESMYVEPGEKKIISRIEAGDGTTAFSFPTIPPPSATDYADRSQGHASIHVMHDKLGRPGGAAEVLLDGVGQSKQDAPRESVYFSPGPDGAFVVDLGRVMPVQHIHSYSWHQHEAIAAHRERAQQCFTLYGWTGDDAPDFNLPPEEAGWTRIARVNTDESLHVEKRLDRPAQQACAISAESGDIGHFRYLLWEVRGGTFYGEIDVFTHP